MSDVEFTSVAAAAKMPARHIEPFVAGWNTEGEKDKTAGTMAGETILKPMGTSQWDLWLHAYAVGGPGNRGLLLSVSPN